MATLSMKRKARREDLGLMKGEFDRLDRLDTPQKIQRFLNSTPSNHELDGEKPLMVHLDCDLSDYPHAIVVFRRGRCWGAISKTNGAPLRFRDPIYRSIRELAMSYFHEYFDKRGRKTLRSYSVAYDMRRIDPEHWVTNGKDCWDVHDKLAALRHFPLVTKRQERILMRRDTFERQISKLVQYPAPPKPKKPDRPSKKR